MLQVLRGVRDNLGILYSFRPCTKARAISDIEVNPCKLNNRSRIKRADILRHHFCTAPKPHINSAPVHLGPVLELSTWFLGRNSNRQEKLVRVCPRQTVILFLS